MRHPNAHQLERAPVSMRRACDETSETMCSITCAKDNFQILQKLCILQFKVSPRNLKMQFRLASGCIESMNHIAECVLPMLKRRKLPGSLACILADQTEKLRIP
jgi:hypothetical protein